MILPGTRLAKARASVITSDTGCQRNPDASTLRNDLLKINSAVSSDDFDVNRIIPLLSAALTKSLNNVLI